MREIARDQVEVMSSLGYGQFSVVGHDRGARCAYRMALDHPRAVIRLAVLDIVPTSEAFRRADMDFSLGFWVWSFLAAPEPVPEQLIAQAPAVIVNHMLDSWSEVPDAFPAEVRAEYIAKFSGAATIHAICEQYRATAAVDYQHDEADRGKRRITCPVLVLWSHTGAVACWYQPLEGWKTWAQEVHGGPVSAGHFIPEEAFDQTTRHLLESSPSSQNETPGVQVDHSGKIACREPPRRAPALMGVGDCLRVCCRVRGLGRMPRP